MPVPSLVTDLSTTISSNSPAGGDAVFPDLDNYLRALSGFVASIYANSGNGWVSPYLPLAGGTLSSTLNGTAAVFSSTVTASALIPSSSTIPTNGLYLSAANTPALASNTTLRWSVNSAGAHTFAAPTAGIAMTVGAFAGSAAIKAAQSLSGSNVYIWAENSSNTASSDAAVIVGVAGTSAGDPFARFDIPGGTNWYLGADNSASDALVIGVGSAPGAADKLTIATSGAATFASTLAITGALTGVTSLTMNGALSGITDLTTTGNTILGNALGDTLTVAADTLKVHSDGRVSGTKLHNIGTVTGTTDQFIASGTYTPTIVDGTNVVSSSGAASQWIRVGNVVNVSGTFTMDPTAGSTSTILGVPLPIASNFSANGNLAGSMTRIGLGTTPLTAALWADAANDRAQTEFTNDSDTASRLWTFNFTYLII